MHERLWLLHDHLLGNRDHTLVLLGNVHLKLEQLVRKQGNLELVALFLLQRSRSVLYGNRILHNYKHLPGEELSKVNVVLFRHLLVCARLKAIDRRGEVGGDGNDRLVRLPDLILGRNIHLR